MSNLWPPAVDQKARCFRLENSSVQRLRLIRSGIWTHWFEGNQNLRRGIGRGRVKKVQTAEHVKQGSYLSLRYTLNAGGPWKDEHRRNLIKITRVRQSGGIFCDRSLTTAAIRPRAARCRQQLTTRGLCALAALGITTSFYLLVTPSFAKYARKRNPGPGRRVLLH